MHEDKFTTGVASKAYRDRFNKIKWENKNMIMENFQDKSSLKGLRVASKMSQEELADKLGVSVEVARGLEDGSLEEKWLDLCREAIEERKECF